MKYSFEQVKQAKGKHQSYTNRLLLEYIFDPLTWIIANFTSLTPNQLSFIGYIFGVIGAVFFAKGQFIIGAICWELLNLFDTFDGRISRLKKTGGSKYGEYVDAYGGYWVFFFLILGLSIGLFQAFSDVKLLILCFILYFLMTIHFVEASLVAYLMGGKKTYTSAVIDHKVTEKSSLINKLFNPLFKLQAKLIKHYGLREPFNMTDVEHIVLLFTPLFSVFVMPVYYEVFIVLCIILFGYSVMWWFKYSELLRQAKNK